MTQVEFHFDFGSPNAYLAHLVIPEIERRTGTKFEYVPVLLGGIFKLTGNRSPAEAFAAIKNKPEYEAPRDGAFSAAPWDHQLSAQSVLPGQHLDAHARRGRGARLGVFAGYIDEMYRRMWSEPKKMDDPEVVARGRPTGSRFRCSTL